MQVEVKVKKLANKVSSMFLLALVSCHSVCSKVYHSGRMHLISRIR